MSAPTDYPASDATPGAATGTAGGGDALSGQEPGGAVEASGDSGAAPSNDDYEAKIRDGGERAVELHKNMQRRADQAAERLRTLEQWVGGLSAYQGQGLNGDQIADAIGEYLEIQRDPKKAAVLQQLKEGQSMPVDTNTYGEPDEFETDEMKEIRALKQELKQLREEQVGQATSMGQQALLRHIGKVASEWELSEEQKSEGMDYLNQQIQAWSKQGEAGRQAIKNLSTPQGAEVVEMLILKKLGRKGLSENLRAQLLRDRSVREQLKTDGPSGRAPATVDLPAEVKSAQDILAFAKAHPEALEQYGSE